MRIILESPEAKRDYYDGYGSYSKDYRNKVWVRNPEELEISKYKLRFFEENKLKNIGHYFDSGFLVLAGEIIPYVYHNSLNYYPDYLKKGERVEEKYYYDYKTLVSRNKGLFKNRKAFYAASNKEIKYFFERSYPDVSDLCLELESPILLIKFYGRYKVHGTETRYWIHKNINLKEIGLTKKFTAPQLYQKLDFFVSNVMVKDEMPQAPQADLDKVKSHGFDETYGFRKRKG